MQNTLRSQRNALLNRQLEIADGRQKLLVSRNQLVTGRGALWTRYEVGKTDKTEFNGDFGDLTEFNEILVKFQKIR